MPRSRRALIALALAAAAFLTYLPALRNGFTNYDDDVYVLDNPQVKGGLGAEGIAWALRASRAANWHPVTWMSHMLDVSLWGLDPRGHHLTSILLHAASAALLFLLLERLTRAPLRSAAVAALFALHPLQVESVVWIAERKNVLSTLLWLVTTIAWIRWVEAPRGGRYAVALACYAAGLAAKPMLVTLPVTLLILDAWPLGRLRVAGDLPRLLREKAPFFALAVASGLVTLAVQHSGRAVGSLVEYPIGVRAANALVSLLSYLVDAIWPAGLSPFYPHPGGSIAAWRVAGAGCVVAAVTLAAARASRRLPWLAAGWLWYLVTLAPVLGIVQVGEQARADRYAYVPLVGIFVAVVWGADELARAAAGSSPRRRALARGALCGLAAAALPAFAVTTARQTGVWRDSFRLFEHALAVDPRNATAHVNLALARAASGEDQAAIAHYERALAIDPGYAIAHNNLGLIRSRQGHQEEALRHYSAALRIDPAYGEAHNNAGIALARLGRTDEAIPRFAEAARISPEDATPLYNWGLTLANVRRWDEAIERFRTAIELQPDYGEAHSNLGAALFAKGDWPGAWSEVALARRHGYEPPAAFLRLLSGKMPPPPPP